MPEHRSPAAPRWAHRLRRALTGALWLVALWWFGGWLWDQPFMERPRMLWRINRMDAPLALPVRSSTVGIVASIREGGIGGKQVWVLGPARQRHYYAHLDGWAPELATGDVVQPGTLLGFVGTTGNAQGTPPHLHYGIYGAEGALNPWPLLQAGAAASTPGAAAQPRR